jgi:hypothetical protein
LFKPVLKELQSISIILSTEILSYPQTLSRVLQAFRNNKENPLYKNTIKTDGAIINSSTKNGKARQLEAIKKR